MNLKCMLHYSVMQIMDSHLVLGCYCEYAVCNVCHAGKHGFSIPESSALQAVLRHSWGHLQQVTCFTEQRYNFCTQKKPLWHVFTSYCFNDTDKFVLTYSRQEFKMYFWIVSFDDNMIDWYINSFADWLRCYRTRGCC